MPKLKKSNKLKDSKIKKVYLYSAVSIIIFITLFLSIGFSAFANNLGINGVLAVIRADKDLRITDFELERAEFGGIVKYKQHGVNSLQTSINLSSKESKITYNVEVTNLGNIAMAVTSIKGLPDNLDYEINNYELNAPICNDKSVCKLGVSKTFELSIFYKENAEVTTDDIIVNLELEFDLAKYKIIFDKNNDNATGIMEDLVVGFEREFYLPKNKYIVEHYSFAGWSKDPSGTGTIITDNQKVKKLVANSQSEVILYATWEHTRYSITYEPNFAKLMPSAGPTELSYGERLEIDVNYTDTSKIYVVMNDIKLEEGIDYTKENQKIIIENVTGDVKFDLNEQQVNSGVDLDMQWLNDYTAEITLNGTENKEIYLRLYKNDVYFGKSSTDLYVKEYATNPLLPYLTEKDEYGNTIPGNNKIFIEYTPISGTATLTGSFTIKLRNAKTNCSALNTAEFIEKTTGKTNFNINTPTTKTGTLTESAAYISVYSVAGNKFDNFKFRVRYGRLES